MKKPDRLFQVIGRGVRENRGPKPHSPLGHPGTESSTPLTSVAPEVQAVRRQLL